MIKQPLKAHDKQERRLTKEILRTVTIIFLFGLSSAAQIRPKPDQIMLLH
jgi:hypothetical protein